jgi:hypothetical protein
VCRLLLKRHLIRACPMKAGSAPQARGVRFGQPRKLDADHRQAAIGRLAKGETLVDGREQGSGSGGRAAQPAPRRHPLRSLRLDGDCLRFRSEQSQPLRLFTPVIAVLAEIGDHAA